MSDSTFDLGTFSQVPLSAVQTTADGTVVPGGPVTWASGDETVLTLEDNGDGTVTAIRAITGPGGVTVTATVTNADGSSASGTIALTLSDTTPPPPPDVVTDVAIVPGTPS